jgi:fatty acid desaturase
MAQALDVKADLHARSFAVLKRRVKAAGLFAPQPGYYAFKIAQTLVPLVVSLTCLAVFDHTWWQLLNAAFLGFASTQIGFLGHDIGHRQVFRGRRSKEVASLVVGNLLVGESWSWWVDKHNRHHGHPNEPDIDPDIAMPMLAFTEREAIGKRGLLRLMVKHQAYLFVPLELLGWLVFLIFSIAFLLTRKPKHRVVEALALGAHYGSYFFLLFTFLTVPQAIAFFVVHRALFGLYAGSVAAPNHKGMPVFDASRPPNFLHQQILGARNVNAHPVTDYWYGGLNYQIEHHLFPQIPRNRLRETQHIVKDFCLEHGIPYHEVGVIRSYKEIFDHLQEVSAPLRGESASTQAPP